MTRPTVDPSWASDPSYSHGPVVGQPNKSQPSTAEAAEGFIPTEPIPADYLNFILNNHGGWIAFLESILASYMLADPVDGNATDPAMGVTGDKYYDTLTINTFLSNVCGRRVWARKLVFGPGGEINARGGSGTDFAITPGTGAPSHTIGGGGNGGTGGGGGSPPAAPSAIDNSFVILGGNGGAGGASVEGAGGAAGTGGIIYASASMEGLHSPLTWIRAFIVGFVGSAFGVLGFWGGRGGGGGREFDATFPAHSGGGGGAGGGVVILIADEIVLNANGQIIVDASGGLGGFANGDSSGAGSGGGGGGGVVGIICRRCVDITGAPATPAVNVQKGFGAVGSGGASGVNGTDGRSFIFILDAETSSVSLTGGGVQRGIASFAEGGSGDGFDYHDIALSPAMANTSYQVFLTPSPNSDGVAPPACWYTTKTTGGFRIRVAAQFTGQVSWEAIPA